jgi:ABC-type uncharacterized transport system ATPase subunit
MSEYVIEMNHIRKEFPGIVANDDITLQLKKGEIHALLGENGAGKSTLMSVLFGLYQPEAGEIKKDGQVVKIDNPNDATALGIGMVHQHFKLIDVFTVLDNIILGAETTGPLGFLKKKEAREKVIALSEKYGLKVDVDAKVEDITVGMQQRVEILKMLYRDNDILIFDEPTAVLTPQEIDELMEIMRGFAKEGKSILFITHKLNEIMAVADRVTVLRKGKYIGTVNTKDTNKQELSNMMVGRPVQLEVQKEPAQPKDVVLKVIIESGALKTPELIRRASLISMFAGADFIKTSTGKIDVAATPEAAFVMCHAIKDYYNLTGRKVGFKAAGGVKTPEDAALYYTIVEEILGEEWLTTDLFRIGASSAANNLISAIEDKDIKYF